MTVSLLIPARNCSNSSSLLGIPGSSASGASGSGKSSLVRAGVVPLLKHDHDRSNWLVLPPFRPGARPLNELAKAYAQTRVERRTLGTRTSIDGRDWLGWNEKATP